MNFMDKLKNSAIFSKPVDDADSCRYVGESLEKTFWNITNNYQTPTLKEIVDSLPGWYNTRGAIALEVLPSVFVGFSSKQAVVILLVPGLPGLVTLVLENNDAVFTPLFVNFFSLYLNNNRRDDKGDLYLEEVARFKNVEYEITATAVERDNYVCLQTKIENKLHGFYINIESQL